MIEIKKLAFWKPDLKRETNGGPIYEPSYNLVELYIVQHQHSSKLELLIKLNQSDYWTF